MKKLYKQETNLTPPPPIPSPPPLPFSPLLPPPPPTPTHLLHGAQVVQSLSPGEGLALAVRRRQSAVHALPVPAVLLQP